ncbi:alpha-1,4-glucan--maltose-1-phosphate maltosyltransferase [Flagellimonas allohymeniacidonis]|uniref:Alpha-1,4-glucan:maltose-1-phosphate maltosyltransferase n=1 Tax=Flagellimonas allohymeniacidonis TaxID=2517819 RepID=A0A4Q8QCX9_9FLAO|nr:alpha-1,4-glucan--maltose-1-phosphate maltosyltransferase [Allomuricauda hymeniacidonis]TAI48292.1 alpha-1,4-glucan--maltose-1-phosphate maltosyltransferase [Allomuricauda hymeniacidonis]
MLRQQRVVIDNVQPQLDSGEFFIKRIVGDKVHVTADILPDGHDVMQAELLYRHEKEKNFSDVRMQHQGNDAYSASFQVKRQGFYEYKLRGWVDYALNWQHGVEAKLKDGQHLKSELLDGVQYLKYLSKKVSDKDKDRLKKWIDQFKDPGKYEEAVKNATSEKLHKWFLKHPQRVLANESKTLQVYVDRKKASFSTWYEFFPRSSSPKPNVHGTFKDCETLLPRIAKMGFDTLYFPPIHPIGEVNRKGKNNTVTAKEEDSGVPWAIGSKHGGHKSIHPELGDEKDFKKLVKKAKELDIEIAMDIAFQAAPDHPYITEHPEWFRKRPDGTIQYAENPPKKYQDIVNFYFETKAYKELWEELKSIVFYWISFGVKVFRVDNPHTKPYYFWNWLISEVKKEYPDALFLAEAFSRPRVMQQLAKQGFSQSYTYFTWRVSKHELTEYVTELTQTDMKEYYRPNFWPNTPDINPYHLQGANESMHIIRYALAATLSSSIGIYGPVYEYMVTDQLPPKEEYLDCEKYEIRHWDWTLENNLIRHITKINAIRHQHPALQQTNNIKFCATQHDNLIAFYKWDDDLIDQLLVVISLDSNHMQQGHIQFPWHDVGPVYGNGVRIKDLVTNREFRWHDEWNFVELQPNVPFHIFQILKD